MKRIYLTLFSLFLFLGSSSIALSQIQFRTLAGDAAPEGIYYSEKKQDIPIAVESGLRSFPFAYTGSNPLLFYKLVTGSDGKIIHEPVVSVDLSNAGSFPLLIFFKDNSSAGKLKILTMKEDATSFPGSTSRFANFSSLPVEITFGSSKFILSPMDITDKHPIGNTVFLAVTALGKSASTPILTHNMLNEPLKRGLILITPVQDNPNTVGVEKLSDNLPQ